MFVPGSAEESETNTASSFEEIDPSEACSLPTTGATPAQPKDTAATSTPVPTPTPATPTPATPTPETPTPATPTPDTSTPATPVPSTPTPMKCQQKESTPSGDVATA